MASIAESKESWEYNLHGNKKYGACGSRDVLILVSRESEGPDIVPRKKGELTQEDKDRLTSEGIPSDCWEDDVKLVDARYRKDNTFKSVTIEDIPHMKKEHALNKIFTLLNNTTQPGVIVHYIGPGRKDTGDWCFSDDFITFEDISHLYTQFFTGRTLCTIADCSYSGQWVESCKDFLDKVGVQPCGHSARKKGIQLKVFGSCQPDEVGSTLLYSARGNGNDKNTGAKYVWPGAKIAPDQTTTGSDFTMITCKKLPEEECALIPNFTFQEKKNRSRIYIVEGEDRGRQAWHYILLVDDPETIRIFEERTQGENAGTLPIDVTDFGLILKTGWGQDSPQDVKDWVERVQNGFEDIQYTSRS